MCLNSNAHSNLFLLNQKDLEPKTKLPKIFCNMHIARRNMHIVIESILPLIYGPQNTPMLWQYIIAGTKGRFKGHTHPQQSKKLYPLASGLSPIHSTHWRGAQGLMRGARGPFPPAAAMVVAVVMPVVFVLRLLKVQ